MTPHDKWTSRDIAIHTYTWKHPPRKPQGNGNIRGFIGIAVLIAVFIIYQGATT